MTGPVDVSRVVTIAGFVAIGVALVAVHVYGKRPDTRVPSLADLCGLVMRDRWGRLGVLFLWLWLGWHFLARS
ncbi:MAG TPA: DUF6186 family protein [Actinocrinis sp.]|nr:DUF6186 family protein [Actinocrinis sp.]